LAIGRPHQVWVADITYIRAAGGFLCLALVMDVSTRAIRGWHLGRSLGQHLTLTALQRALDRHPAPEIHHSDSGVQYASPAYVRLLEERGVRISMAEVGEAWRNGYAERLIRTIKEEEVDLTEYLGCHDAHQQMSRFLEDVYMHQRIHSSLSYLTPAEFEERRHQEHSSGPEVELKMA
jgi:transposase InsO family protein